MKISYFASRNSKEIVRDPLNIAFGLGFPLVIMFLLSAIQAKVPINLFEIEKLSPGIAVFGLSFISLFSATLIAKDKTTSFLMRLFASPMSSSEFIIGYTWPMLPLALAQSAVCFLAAGFWGLKFDINVLLALVILLPTALLFIGIGLLCGSIFNDKQVGGICGALLTNLSAWLSGVWFDLNLVGGWFQKIANALPFVHAVNATRAALDGRYSDITKPLIWVTVYALVIFVIAIIVFKRKMSSDNL